MPRPTLTTVAAAVAVVTFVQAVAHAEHEPHIEPPEHNCLQAVWLWPLAGANLSGTVFAVPAGALTVTCHAPD